MSARGLKRRLLDERGQMTIELLVVLPVVIIVAVIAVNVMTFFGQCAEFDRVSRNAVRICATSPAYGQELDDSIAQVEEAIVVAMGLPSDRVFVAAAQDHLGHVRFSMSLEYEPTLFGMGLRHEVLGVSLPMLTHSSSLVVDVYKPGMLL